MRNYQIAIVGIIIVILSSFTGSPALEDSGYCTYLAGNDAMTRFHMAACRGDVKSVKEFIKEGIDINKLYSVNAKFWKRNNRFEFTALHTAVLHYNAPNSNKESFKQIIKLLVKHGINTEVPYRYWYSQGIDSPPNHLSESRPLNMVRDYEIAEILRQGGAKMSPLTLSRKDGSFNYYQGEIIVSGTIRIDPYSEYYPGLLCMDVDKNTFHLIPRVGDYRSAWFCLKGTAAAVTMLKIDSKKIKTKCFSGSAKIKVSNYRQYTGESEDFDTAKLLEVIEMNKYSYTKCSNQQ